MSEVSALPSNHSVGREREGVGEVQPNESHSFSPAADASNPEAPSGRGNKKDYWSKALGRLDRRKRNRIERALAEQRETHGRNGRVDSNSKSGDAGESKPRVPDRLIATDRPTSWPDVLAEVCRQRQEEHKGKKWKLRFAGRDVNLRTTLENWVKFFNNIKQIGDVVVNVDPLHAGLPWAAIRLIITVCNLKQDMPQFSFQILKG
jgi:hypothetical protein